MRGAILGVVLLIAFVVVQHAYAHREKPLAKMSERQLRREAAHSRHFVSFFRHHPYARYVYAFRHDTCFSVRKVRRGRCFYVRNRVRHHERRLARIERMLTPPLPPHYQQWLCIHGYEGAWNANTGNGFYGGLQFMADTWNRNGGQRYAPYAHLATPLEQMWVAESAWRESGGSFSQWPNTARMCGLL